MIYEVLNMWPVDIGGVMIPFYKAKCAEGSAETRWIDPRF